MTNEHTSLEKYTSHTLFEMVSKGLRKGYMCERWVGDWTDYNILTPVPLSSVALLPHSVRLLNQGSWGPSLLLCAGSHCLELQQTDSNELNLSVAPGYIIVWHPLASCGRHICTQFNPSTVKVIPWYLRLDALVIYTGASLIWQLSRGSICYMCVNRTISVG